MRDLRLPLFFLSLCLLVSACVDSDLRNPGPAGPGPFAPDAHDDEDSRQIGFRMGPADFLDSMELVIHHDEGDSSPDTLNASFDLCDIRATGTIANINSFSATGTFFTAAGLDGFCGAAGPDGQCGTMDDDPNLFGLDGLCGTVDDIPGADDNPAFFGPDGICGTPDDLTRTITIQGTITPFQATLTVDMTGCGWELSEDLSGLFPCSLTASQLLNFCP